MENPFIVTGKIKPEYFCDRVEESKRLIRCVTNGGNLVLVSPRRLGKTGLINYCFEDKNIKDLYDTIFIDILSTTSLNELTFILGKAVFNTLKMHGAAMVKTLVSTLKSISGSFGFDPVTGLPTFDVKLGDIAMPQYTLEEIFQCIEANDRRCIIAIDEFQQIINYPEKNIEALLRTHIQHSSKASFIFAGSERHIMNELFLNSARPFYNSADMLHLDPIEKEIYSNFVTYHFQKKNKVISRQSISNVYDIFKGNTYYLQKTFREAYAITAEGKSCSDDEVKTIIQEMTTDNNHKYSEILSRLSLPQKELLFAIHHEGRATQITSGKFIKKHNLQSTSSVQSAMKKLIEYGLVTTEKNEYYIEDPLMNLWLND